MQDTKSNEADWTKSISNETICSYFYAMFFIVAVVAALALGVDIWLVTKNPRTGVVFLFKSLVTFLIAILNTLFLYTMCARSLLK